MTSPLLVNVAELLRRAGSVRELDRQVDVDAFKFDDARIVANTKVEVGLTLEALTDGIVVHGKLKANWNSECRRCLRPMHDVAEVEVHELYQAVISDPDAYLITGEQLDLMEMVRENVLLAVPLAPLCSADCPGLCLQCGADLQTGVCGCKREVRDERWAALDALKADENQ